MSPRIGVLALQGDVREHAAMLAEAGAEATPVRRPAELASLDGLVIPGGESTTMAKLARTFDMLDPLREAVRSGLPVYGTCAGMVLLASQIEDGIAGQETIGGLDIVVRRNAFGRQVDSFEASVRVEPGGPVDGFDFPAVFIRAPWVEKTGQDVEIVARVAGSGAEPDGGLGRIVAVRQANLLATSFHPEITGDHRMHALFVAMVEARPGASNAETEKRK